MSWHSSAILIQTEDPPGDAYLLSLLGFPGAMEIGPIDFETATSVEVLDNLEGGLGAAVARVDGWVSIWGPMLAADPDAVAQLSSGGAAFTLMLEGATGSAGFEWFRDGSLLRRWSAVEGAVIEDEGEPLAEENGGLTDDPERGILLLLERLVGPLDVLADAQYNLYRFPEG